MPLPSRLNAIDAGRRYLGQDLCYHIHEINKSFWASLGEPVCTVEYKKQHLGTSHEVTRSLGVEPAWKSGRTFSEVTVTNIWYAFGPRRVYAILECTRGWSCLRQHFLEFGGRGE